MRTPQSAGRIPRSKATLSTAILLSIALWLPVLGATYHVAKTGDDGNPGSEASPFITIGHAAQIMQPGDMVIVHEGVYREWVQPARGGSSENARITYMAASGENVVIKGSERIANWQDQGGGVWRADVPDNTFNETTYNPYTTTLAGRYTNEYLDIGAWHHLGEVYLDGKIYSEMQSLSEVQNTAGSWYTSHSGSTTTIYANFNAANPNTQLAEINVRESCFGNPTVSSGIDYITVDGFTAMQSSEEWSPTYLGITSHGVIFGTGRYWIIQNCRVKYAKMRGICIDGPNVEAHHIVRNNMVTNCGTCGIAGQYAHNSVISGNWVQDIGGRDYYGYEISGIKIHQCRRHTISGNVVISVTGLHYARGIWLDWPGTGNRLTGNFITGATDNYIFLERVQNEGVNLIDNNILVGGFVNITGANAFVHNLLVNTRLGYDMSGGSADRVYNNIFAGGLNAPNPFYSPSNYNVYLNGSAKLSTDNGGVVDNSVPFNFALSSDTVNKTVAISFDLGTAPVNLGCPLITSDYIGIMWGSSLLTNPDGSQITVNKDLYQNCRGTSPRPGPFQMINAGPNSFTFGSSDEFNWSTPCTPYEPVFTSVLVTPNQTSVQPGTSQQFVARATDQFGGAMDPQPAITWSLSGSGNISSAGLYTADPQEGGPYTIAAQATIGGVTRSATASISVSNALPGLLYDYYAIDGISALPSFSNLTPTESGITDVFGLQVAQRTEYIALRFTGYLSVPNDGSYTFFMSIDDEASLKIDGTEILRTHWTDGENSRTIALSKGMHPISLEYYQGNGGVGLTVSWQPEGQGKQVIPASVLFQNNSGATVMQRPVSSRMPGATPVVLYNILGRRIGALPGDLLQAKAQAQNAGNGVLLVAPASSAANRKSEKILVR